MADDLAFTLSEESVDAVEIDFNGNTVSLVWEPISYDQDRQDVGINIQRRRLYLSAADAAGIVPGQYIPFDGEDWFVDAVDPLEPGVEMELSRNIS